MFLNLLQRHLTLKIVEEKWTLREKVTSLSLYPGLAEWEFKYWKISFKNRYTPMAQFIWLLISNMYTCTYLWFESCWVLMPLWRISLADAIITRFAWKCWNVFIDIWGAIDSQVCIISPEEGGKIHLIITFTKKKEERLWNLLLLSKFF